MKTKKYDKVKQMNIIRADNGFRVTTGRPLIEEDGKPCSYYSCDELKIDRLVLDFDDLIELITPLLNQTVTKKTKTEGDSLEDVIWKKT